jgi:hypothetical protein
MSSAVRRRTAFVSRADQLLLAERTSDAEPQMFAAESDVPLARYWPDSLSRFGMVTRSPTAVRSG